MQESGNVSREKEEEEREKEEDNSRGQYIILASPVFYFPLLVTRFRECFEFSLDSTEIKTALDERAQVDEFQKSDFKITVFSSL